MMAEDKGKFLRTRTTDKGYLLLEKFNSTSKRWEQSELRCPLCNDKLKFVKVLKPNCLKKGTIEKRCKCNG